MKVNEFLNYCEKRNLSSLTVRNYRRHLKELVIFLKGTKDLDETTPTDLLEFVEEQRELVSPRSVNIKMASIRVYFDFLCRFEGLKKNPALVIAKCREEKKLPRYIPQEKMDTLLSKLPESSFREIRLKAVISFFYMTGARCCEVARCRDFDVDFSAGRVLLFGKGKKERYVPICSKLAMILRDYMMKRDLVLPFHDESLFCSVTGQRLTDWELRKMMIRPLCSIVPREYAHPHILRHTFATVLLNHGKPIEQISRWLGHSNIAVTQTYLTIANNPQVNNFEKVF